MWDLQDLVSDEGIISVFVHMRCICIHLYMYICTYSCACTYIDIHNI